MKDWLAQTGQKLLAMKLAIAWFILFIIISLGSTILAVLSGVQWETLDGQARFMVKVGIVVGTANTIAAFLKQTISRLDPDIPLGAGESSTKTETSVKTTTAKGPPAATCILLD